MEFGRPIGWWLISIGVTPSRWPCTNCGTIILEVKRRRSGGLQSTLVTWVEEQGHRYLVTMAGKEPQWVKNMRAAGGRVTFRRGRERTLILLHELPVEQRAPILRAWYKFTSVSANPRWHFRLNRKAPIEDFQRIAADHPVFLVVLQT
jgi:hypothetical protein